MFRVKNTWKGHCSLKPCTFRIVISFTIWYWWTRFKQLAMNIANEVTVRDFTIRSAVFMVNSAAPPLGISLVLFSLIWPINKDRETPSHSPKLGGSGNNYRWNDGSHMEEVRQPRTLLCLVQNMNDRDQSNTRCTTAISTRSTRMEEFQGYSNFRHRVNRGEPSIWRTRLCSTVEQV